jgi:hypothetical protein
VGPFGGLWSTFGDEGVRVACGLVTCLIPSPSGLAVARGEVTGGSVIVESDEIGAAGRADSTGTAGAGRATGCLSFGGTIGLVPFIFGRTSLGERLPFLCAIVLSSFNILSLSSSFSSSKISFCSSA